MTAGLETLAGRQDESLPDAEDRPVLCSFCPDSGVATVRFNRPTVLNAIDRTMARALLETARSLARRPGVRCIVLTGSGAAFMAGGDVSDFASSPGRTHAAFDALIDALNPAILTLRTIEAPILAGVNGVAAGAGLSLALMADIVLAAPEARFLMAYDRLGAVPDCGGSWFLTRKVGAGRAAELMMLGRTLTAQDALEWGIVTEVAPPGGFAAALNDMGERLARGPRQSFAAFRRLADSAPGQPLSAHLESERAAFHRIIETPDFREGTRAFLEKRAPLFGQGDAGRSD